MPAASFLAVDDPLDGMAKVFHPMLDWPIVTLAKDLQDLDVIGAFDRSEPAIMIGEVNSDDTTRIVAPAGIVSVPVHEWTVVVGDNDGRQTAILCGELNFGCISGER